MATTEPVIVPITPITNKQLTTGELNGDGVFDTLMKSTKAHLDEEFSKGRIKGAEYSQVYLGSMTAVMAQGTQFLLQRDQSTYQALLLQKQTEMIEIQKANLILEGEKLAFEKLKAEQEAKLVEAQVAKVKQDTLLSVGQTALVAQQLITEKTNVEDTDTGTIGKTQKRLDNENSNLTKTGSKIDAEKLLIDQNKANAVKQATVISNQGNKIASEKLLIDQKKTSEEAQTQAGKATAGSVIGSQIKLYEAQKQGFTRNSEAKAAKIALDAFAIQVGAPDYPVSRIPDSIESGNTTSVFSKLFANMSLEP